MRLNIAALDSLFEIPDGSLVLLLEEVGAGAREFAYTVMRNLREERPILYISVHRPFEAIERDITKFLGEDTAKEVLTSATFRSLEKEFYADTIVPTRWYTDEISLTKGDLLRSLTDEIKELEGALLFIDSLSAIVRKYMDTVEMKDLIALMSGLSSVSIRKGLVIMPMMSAGVFGTSLELEFMDASNIVFYFRKVMEANKIERRLSFEKLEGDIARLSAEGVEYLEFTIAPRTGFDVTSVKYVYGV